MPAITQLIPNYVGGVSSQPDEKKLPGQVREIDNGYVDATFGLTKRPGMQWIKTVANYDDDVDELENASWFFINRNDFEVYFGCITKGQNIRIWNAITTEEADVFGPNVVQLKDENGKPVFDDDGNPVPELDGNGNPIPIRLSDEPINSSPRNYLELVRKPGESERTPLVPHGNFEVVTVLAQSFLINKTKKVESIKGDPYTLRTRATVKIKFVEDLQDYQIFITLDSDPETRYEAKFKTVKLAITDELEEDGSITPAQTPTNADNILSNLREVVEEGDPDGRGSTDNVGILDLNIPGMTVRKFETSLELECTEPFRIDVQAGKGGNALEVYQDEIGNSSRLSESSVDGRLVKIVNTESERASYFAKFVANDPLNGDDVVTPGTGFWEEAVGWDDPEDGGTSTFLAGPGLDDSTMPHVLLNPEVDVFVFKQDKYTKRLCGNSLTNEDPSFVDNYINEGFIINNRLGFLSAENVILSQPDEFENFYFTSAQTVIDSDPIDLNCSSTRPANLFSAVPATQGMILFSANEQFNMFADGDTLTPSTTVVRSISNYEAATNIKAVDIGTSIIFLSTTSAYTRTMAMSTRGQDNNPIVVDIGKVASEYVPKDVDFLVASPQNSFIAITSQNGNDVYFYRFFNNGERDIMQAWFKWILPGHVQTFVVADDQVFAIIKGNGEYNLMGAALNQSLDAGMAALQSVNPRMDMYYSPLYVGTITYDSETDTSTIPKPYANNPAYKPIIVEVPEIQMPGFSGRISDIPLRYVNPPLEFDGDTIGYLPEVTVKDNGDWTIRGNWEGKEKHLLGGIKYTFSVELPTTFYRRENISDYTANLTLGRYKFAFGDTGFVEFKSKSFGSDEWNKVEPVPDADYYNADTAPFTSETIITVPIYQKNKYFNFKIESDTPAPVSINSMMWEGQYYPRFYKRV